MSFRLGTTTDIFSTLLFYNFYDKTVLTFDVQHGENQNVIKFLSYQYGCYILSLVLDVVLEEIR